MVKKIKKDPSIDKWVPTNVQDMLRHQHYGLFGHSAVKICHYTKTSIKGERVCYKQKYYGINAHQCIQMTPAVIYCNQACTFCWRPITKEPIDFEKAEVDEPATIFENCLDQQRILLSGLGGIKDRIDLKKWEESKKPKHVAISLAGEPTLYPKLKELIEYYHSKDFTTFVVSNATRPDVIEKINPTQLYLSLDAPNEKIHKFLNKPQEKGTWKKINKSLELLADKKCKTNLRITVVKGINDVEPEKYAELIKKANADFVEVKSYMWVGFSRYRLKKENMPSFDETKAFAQEINKHLGYELTDEMSNARVVLLWNGKTPKMYWDKKQ